jgi:hypothetical protein
MVNSLVVVVVFTVLSFLCGEAAVTDSTNAGRTRGEAREIVIRESATRQRPKNYKKFRQRPVSAPKKLHGQL